MFSFETEKYSLAELRAMIMDEIRETGDEESPVTYTLEGKLVNSDETKQEPLRYHYPPIVYDEENQRYLIFTIVCLHSD